MVILTLEVVFLTTKTKEIKEASLAIRAINKVEEVYFPKAIKEAVVFLIIKAETKVVVVAEVCLVTKIKVDYSKTKTREAFLATPTTTKESPNRIKTNSKSSIGFHKLDSCSTFNLV